MSTMTTRNTTATPSTQQPAVSHDKIAMRAYEKWEKGGRMHGCDRQNWVEAERELLAEMTQKVQKTPPVQRR